MSSSSSANSSPQGQVQGRYAAASRSITTKRSRAPASEKAIHGLRRITKSSSLPSEDLECAICLQDFDFAAAAASEDEVEVETSSNSIPALPCSHAFHQHCISRWLRCTAVCPLCRHPLPTQEDEDEDGAADDEERRFWRRMRTGPAVSARPSQEDQDFLEAAVARGVITVVAHYEYDEPTEEEVQAQRRTRDRLYSRYLELLNSMASRV
ncbi:hypothetical protein U9M48_006493 [Paspalum notatum var. saurae]|uniref:RING-type domain-containing protein n=1 Tax=Paspalum notatum var. saurae TaxID=547442 RepID=A0AAQ3SLU2_PASNO